MKKDLNIKVKRKVHYFLFLVLLITATQRCFGQATIPFVCNDGFGYLFQGSPADVFQVDLQTGISTKVKNSISVGAVSAGYNQVDDFIWMVDKVTRDLIKVDANWNTTAFNTGLPRNIHVVDIDANGIFYAYANGLIYRYDLNTPTPTPLTTLNSGGISVSDFAFSPLDGFIYGIANDGRIFRTNPANGSTTVIRTISGLPNQTYGAVYFDGEGTLYLSGNSNGEIYKVSNAALTNPNSTETPVFFSNGPSASQNDGARCASAPLCKVGTTKPTLNQTSAANSCSVNTVNLANISANNTPDGTMLTWHTNTPTTNVNRITNLTITSSGTYYATFYDAENDCYSASSQVFTVTINPVPTTPTEISASNNTLCFGESTNLSGTCPVGTINWYVNNTNGTLAGTGSPLTVTPATTTTYIATCKTLNPNCESPASSPVTVTVNPKPAPPAIVAGSSRICLGTSTTLTALGCNGTVNWSTGEAGTSISVSPTTPTSYSATCTDARGCISDASNSNIEITIASIFFSVDRLNVCSGESVTLTMGGCNSTRAFFADGNLISSSSSNVYIDNPNTNVTYTATCDGVPATACATNSTGGVPVTVRTTPLPPNIFGNQTICVGESATLTASGCNGTVNWSDSQTGSVITVSPATTSVYTATCIENGCVSGISEVVNVWVDPIPDTPTGTTSATICSGESVDLGGNCTTGSLVWYNDAALSAPVSMPVSPTINATYYATCKTTNCGSSSVAVFVTVNPTPNTPINTLANPSTICQGKSTVLSGSCGGGSSIAFFRDAARTNRLTSATIAPASSTTYYAACELAGCRSNGVPINVDVNPSPAAPSGLTSSTTICKGSSILLNGSCPSGSTIQWYQGVVDASSLVGTGTGTSVSPGETTIYVATCKNDVNNCESAQSNKINISVSDTPNAPTNVSVSSVSICSGTAVTLSGNCSGGTLKFYTDAAFLNEVSATNTPATTTTYYAACVVGICKSASVNSTVNVTTTPTTPTAIMATETEICSGEATTLAANCSAGTLKWYTNEALTIETPATVSPTASTTYYASCVNDNCKSPYGNITINVVAIPPTPTAVSSSPTEVCADAVYSLSANCSTGNVAWFSNASLTASINPANRTATASETFYVACEVNGCTGTSVAFTTTVNEVPPSPTLIPSDRNLCLGGSLNLTATGCDGRVSWTINGSAGPTTAQIFQTPTATTVYAATCTNPESGCVSPVSATTTITVVSPPPNPSITTTNTEVCAGESFTLTALNCLGTTSWFQTGDNASLGSANSITITPTATNTYFATCTTSGTVVECESGSSDPISVVYNPQPPTPTISTTAASICIGESTTLTATGCGGIVNWSDGSNGNSVSVNPNESTTYTATCVENGCTSSSSTDLLITVNTIPAAPINLAATDICSGESSSLTGSCSNGAAIEWYTDSDLSNVTSATVSPVTSTTYYAVCQLNNCQSTSESVMVNVTAVPSAPSVSASFAKICFGGSTELVGSCTSGNLIWYSDSGLTSKLNSATISPTVTTTYFASCVNGNCKSPASSQQITVNALPVAPTLSTNSTTVCSATFFDITANGCTGTVNWSNGETGNQISVNLTSDESFTATCTDANGCVSPPSDALEITVTLIPDLPIITPANSSVCPGGSTVLTASGCNGTLAWFQSGMAGTSLGNTSSITVSPSENTSYFTTCSTSNPVCSSGPSEAAVITINEPPGLSLTKTDALCAGENTGTISATGSGGNAPYTYSRNGVDFQSDNVFTGLSFGNYTIKIKDADGCTNSTQIAVEQPLVLNFSVVTNPTTCAPEGAGSLIVTDIAGGTAPFTYQLNGGDFQSNSSFTELTANTYQVTVKDKNGCTRTRNATVSTVPDNQDPVISCPANTVVSNDANTCGAIVSYALPTATDNCTVSPSITRIAGLASENQFPIGTSTVEYTATDLAGNTASCSFTITVNDTQNPVITCPENISINVTEGICGAVVTFTAPVGTDNCSGSTTVQTGGLASGSTFPVGTTTNTFIVTDAAGNSTSCSFMVTVVDNIPPVIPCPDDVVVSNDEGECGAIVNYIPPTATDNCVGGSGTIFQGFESGDRGAETCWSFPGVSFQSGAAISGNFGARTGQLTGNPNSVVTPFLQLNGSGNLTFSHRLSANNGSSQTLTVYLVDEAEDRTQIFQHIYDITQGTTVLNESIPLTQTGIFKIQWEFTGSGGNSRGFLDDLVIPASYAFATDCSAQPSPKVEQTDNTGLTVSSFFPVGTTTLEYTATDAAGNSSKCTFDITVNDTESPEIICPSNITMDVTSGLCDRAKITFADPTTSDNCAGETFSQIAGLPSGSNFPVGTTTNTFEVTDAAGNKNLCSFNVTVNAPPTLVLSIADQINVACFAEATGSFAVNVSGGATPYSYVLDGGTPQASNTFTGLAAGTYNVVVTDGNGCSQSISTTITEPTQLAVSVISQTEEICENTNTGSITVAGSGGTAPYEFKLNNGVFQASASFTNLTSGNYTITVKDGNGCLSTVTAAITTFAQPTPTAGSNAPLCVGQSLNLTATGGVSYAWSGPNFTSDLQNPVIENITAANAGIYTVTVISPDGCKASTTTNVVVNPLPLVISTSNSPVCETKTLNFTTQAVAGANYAWIGPNNFTSNLQNPSIPNAPLAANGTYKLIITNANGCKDSTEVSVVIKKRPTATATSNSPVCAGDMVSLAAANETGALYAWSGPNSFTSTEQNPQFTATSAIQSGTYEVVVTLDGCTNSARTDVVVFDLPVANASSNAPVCEGKPLNFTAENAGSGATYSWSGPNGFTSNLQNPSIAFPTVAASGEYILTVIKNNCVSRDTIDVVVKLKPSVSIDPIAPVCATETLTFSATATNGVTYAWSGPDSFTSTLQNPEIPNATTAATGVYELIVTLNGCTNSTSTNVRVNVRPTASVMGTTPVCEDETVDLSAANAGTGATYSWTGPVGFTSNLQNPSFDNAVPSQSGFYVMTATLGDCSSKDSVKITINPKPTLSITSAACLPDLKTYQVKLTASGGKVTTSAGEITDNGNGEFTINNILSGTNIVVTVTSNESCIVSENITAPDCSCPVVEAPISSGDQVICRTEDNPTLSVTVGVNETVDWYTTASGGTAILENSNTFTPTETSVGPQTYYAQTRNTINQCVSSTRTEVKLTIKPKPEITVNSVSTICQDDTIRLTSTADLTGVSYQWSGPNGFSATTQNATIPTAKVIDSGFYKLVVDLNGCTDADSVEITVKPKPTPIAGSNSPVCEGFPINLSLNEDPATTYVWSGPKNYSSGLPNPSIAAATPDMSGTYQVIATLNGCKDTTTTEVVINAQPKITTTAPNCAVDLATYAVKFTAVGGTVVTSAGIIVDDSVKNIPSGTNIKLIITSAEGCQDSTEVIAPDCLCPTIEAPVSAGDSAICENTPIPTLETAVNSDETVDWYDAPSGGNLIAENTLTYTPTNTAVGEYTFYAEARRTDISIRKCVSSTRTAIKLTIKPLPVVLASSNSPVCEGDTLRLTAQEVSGATYEWFKNGTVFTTQKDTTIVKSNLNLNGTFTLKITLNGCENTNTTDVLIKPLPVVTALSNATDNGICATDTIRLFVDGAANADTYEWIGPQSFTATGASVQRFAGSTDFAGKYVVTSTLDGCSTTDTVTVNLRPLPNAVANNTSPVCAGDSIRFSAATVPNATYEWFDPAGNTLGAGKDIVLRNTTTSQSGKYTVKVTLNGCSKVDTTEVIVKHRPQVIATDVTICSGDTLFLNATRDSTSAYTWMGPLSFTSLSKDTLIAKAKVSNSGNYMVTATLNGCSSKDTATVVVKPLPLTVPMSNSPVCEASPLNLSAENAGANATYSWSGPEGFTAEVQNPVIDAATMQKAGFYKLTVSRNGCLKTDSVEIKIKKLPEITFKNNSPICVNDTLRLSITPIAGATYQWSGPKEFMSTDSAINIPNIQTAHAGMYQVTVKLNGCEKTDSTTVNVVENPLAEIMSNSPVCELDTLKLTAANAGNGAAYEWSGPNNFSSSESNPSVAPMTAAAAGFYYLKVTLNNCVSFDTTEVQFKPLPKINVTSNSPVCVGDTIRIATGNPQLGTTFNWSGPGNYTAADSAVVIADAQSINGGLYQLTSVLNGCFKNDSIRIVVKDLPEANAEVEQDSLCVGETIKLTAKNAGTDANYRWVGPDDFVSNEQNPDVENVTAKNSGKYFLTVTLDDCQASDSVDVFVRPLPEISLDSAFCSADLLSYSVKITTNSDNISTSIGTVDGQFIRNIPKDSASVKITVISQAGCVDSLTVNAPNCECPVIPLPEFAFTDSTVCFGTQTPTFTPVLGKDQVIDLYSVPTGGIKVDSNKLAYQFADLQPNTYTLFAEARDTVTNCVSASRVKLTLKVNPLPMIEIDEIPVLCERDTLKLTAQVEGTFVWFGPNGFTSDNMAPMLQVDPSDSGGYIVVATLNKCVNSDTVQVIVNPILNVGVSEVFCSVDLKTYTVELQTSAVNITASAGTVDGKFIREIPKDSASVQITVTSGEGCANTITVNAPNCKCPRIDLPEFTFTDSTICFGSESPVFTATVGDNQTVDFYDAATGGTKLDSMKLSYQFAENEAGSYEVFAESRDTLSNCVSSSRTRLTFTINELPALEVDSVFCSADRETYSIKITSNSDSISTSAGTVDGQFIREIPKDTASVTIKVLNASGCEDSVTVNAPDCECKVVPKPEFTFTDSTICFGSESPVFTATVGDNQTVDFYDAATGGTKLDSMKLSYQFAENEAGSYEVFVESRDTLSNCVSSSRTRLSFTINALPTLGVDSVFCSVDRKTYSVKITSNSDSISTSAGTVDGQFIREIPKDTASVTIKVLNVSGCEDSVTVNAPDCECKVVPKPEFTFTDSTSCFGSESPVFTATIGDNQTVDFYDAATGGTKLDSMKLSYQFAENEAGSYEVFAESRDTLSNCVSSSRTRLSFTINELPALEVDSVFCSADRETYSIKLTSNSDSISTSAGTVDGQFIREIPKDTASVTIKVLNAMGCEDSVTVNASNCETDKFVKINVLKTVNSTVVMIGDTVTYTISLWNSGTADTTGVEIEDALYAGASYVSYETTSGTYDIATKLWQTSDLPAQGDTVVLTMKVKVIAGGPWINSARLLDKNGMPDEIIISQSCVSAIIPICPQRGERIELSSSVELPAYQWYKNGNPIVGATQQTYIAETAGAYTVRQFATTDSDCAGGNCCPIIIAEVCDCKADICVPFIIKKVEKQQ